MLKSQGLIITWTRASSRASFLDQGSAEVVLGAVVCEAQATVSCHIRRLRSGSPRSADRPGFPAWRRLPQPGITLDNRAVAAGAEGRWISVQPAMYSPSTTAATNAASGRYMRCSKAKSGIGMTLELGSDRKANQAARLACFGHRQAPTEPHPRARRERRLGERFPRRIGPRATGSPDTGPRAKNSIADSGPPPRIACGHTPTT